VTTAVNNNNNNKSNFKSIIRVYNTPTRCNSGSIVFIKNYK